MDKRYFSDKLVEWYQSNKRDLPWRQTQDPYKIWLSEVILQQTRVAQGMPYYLRFLEKFPDVGALAAASEQEVLRLWQGLGYYTRARNLHKCAQEVVNNFKSQFPPNFQLLKKLRGIGDYTAAAIASFSYREKVAVVDGNVFRVLARVFGVDVETNSPEGKSTFTKLANDLISNVRPDLHNQAIMEFGALFCTPRNPDCPRCIFLHTCFAAEKGLQHMLPLKAKKKASRRRYFYYFVVKRGKSLLMGKRSERDIWQGLYDFYLIEKEKPENVRNLVEEFNQSACSNINVQEPDISAEYKHVLTHQIIFSRFIVVEDVKGFGVSDRTLKFYSAKKIAALPKPVLISRFLEDHYFL
ncbi:MAG: A/G-specific adenine glycosylase [Chryseolinea sp.]